MYRTILLHDHNTPNLALNVGLDVLGVKHAELALKLANNVLSDIWHDGMQRSQQPVG